MLRSFSFRNVVLTTMLMTLTLTMTSCQGLVDAVFGTEDHPAQSGSTIPDIQIDNATLTLSVGQTASRPATAKTADIQLTYASSSPAVATVSQAGIVTAFSAGETTITVSAPQISKSVSFKVVVNAISAEQLADVDKATPLTILPQDDGKITVTFNNGITLAGDIHYTINDGQEQTIAKNTAGAFDIEVKKGDVVQLYSQNSALGGGSSSAARALTRAVDEGAKYINIRPSMKTEIFGNVMSLLKGKDNLESATALEAKNAFYGLFAGAEQLVNNADRLLVLPATTLTEGCYQDMFNGCKGIEKAPELPAPKLEKNCYQEMFYDCAKLNHVKCLATDIKAENSTKDWLGKAGTEATETKVLETLVDMTPNSDDGVPTSWTAQKIVLVESVTLGKSELTLVIGEADVTLTATVKPENATDPTVTWTSDKPAVATVNANGTVHAVAAGEATITATAGDKSATCKVTVKEASTATDLSTLTADYEAKDGETLTGTLNGSTQPYKISIADGATVTLDGITINGTTGRSYNWAGITCVGDATIILKDGTTNTVKGFNSGYSGIFVPKDKTLTIKGETEGTGKLIASSNGYGAGIGGGDGISSTIKNCGNIVIQGGVITATGGSSSAGIGSGGNGGICGDITISGGTVTATGGEMSAAIGSGYGSASCGKITITDGVTSVTATKGSYSPNSIGAGDYGSTCGTVTIGGNVGVITVSPYTYPAPAIGDVGNPIGFDGGGDPLANN